MRLSACEPFGEQQIHSRERLPANDNSALYHRDLSLLSLIPADGGPAKIAAKAERTGIVAAVGTAIGLFIGPVALSCLMLGIWSGVGQ